MEPPTARVSSTNNIQYHGRVYHVQTEDSGAKRPHVVTHLFADGGRIIKTTKTSYASFVADDDVTSRVRQLMRHQHKEIVVDLKGGVFDAIIDDRAAPRVE